MIAEAEERSRSLLEAGLTPGGYVASPSFDHYASIWARDACIAALGALTTGEPRLIEGAAATLDTLAAGASPLGQVPAVVNPQAGTWDWGEGGAVDPSCWLPIVAGHHLAVTGDLERAAGWWPAVEAALAWLAHQDVTGSGLISAAPSTDWMDAALTRSGRTLHLNALYAWAAVEAERMAVALGRAAPTDAAALRRRVDVWFWPDPAVDLGELYAHGFAHQALRVSYWEAGSFRRRHYASHIVHAAYVEACDVLANLIAVLGGVAGADRAVQVLAGLDREEVLYPYPSRSLAEPVGPRDGTGMLIAAAEVNIPPRWHNRPGRYHNGAVWPYIGGFHAAALAGRSAPEAGWSVLDRLAAANALDGWSFPEWIDRDGAAGGARHQLWNAGSFLYGLSALRRAGGPEAGR